MAAKILRLGWNSDSLKIDGAEIVDDVAAWLPLAAGFGRIHQQMVLCAAEFVRPVVFALASHGGGLNRLGGEDAGARLGLSTGSHSF
jgi:hypothetical protein